MLSKQIPVEFVDSSHTPDSPISESPMPETPVAPAAEFALAVEETPDFAAQPIQTKKVKARKVVVPVSDLALADETLENDSQTADLSSAAASPAAVSSAAVSPFQELSLHPSVVEAILEAGYFNPTPIQLETIPHVLDGQDIIGKAETGSGKTAAFACPLLSRLNPELKKPQVLVLAPTRELAIQVTESFQRYGSQLAGFKAVTIYGGQSYEIQNNALRRGVQVVVGTPGRIMDHLRQRTLDLSNLKTIVLDEADEMLRMGFIDDVEWILSQIPEPRQTLLFSATMPAPIQRIAQNYLKDPVTVSIDTESGTADSITQSCLLIQARTKLEMLAQILDSESTDAVIVFVKTRDATVMVADQLSARGFSAAPLNGDIPQNQRERTIEQLKSGRLKVLVATDVAARGLDVQRISHVINYDFPHDTEAYIHRIGRTGRAGRSGVAILFVDPKEKGKLKRLERETNQQIEFFRPKSVKQVNAIRVERFKQRITDHLAKEQTALAPFAKIVSELQEQQQISFEQMAAALAFMAQGDTPLFLSELVNHRSNFDKDTEKGGKRFQGAMATYRVEVGRNHGVKPGNIVGAVTNETDLNYASIGRIKLHDDFSLIDLPANLPAEQMAALQSVSVLGRQLRISLDSGHPTNRRSGKPRFEPNSKNTRSNSFAAGKRPKKERPFGGNSVSSGDHSGRSFGGSERGGPRSSSKSPFGKRSRRPESGPVTEKVFGRSKKRDQASSRGTDERRERPKSDRKPSKFIKIRG
jgi:ATP-dependent RNA helicase DeaD